MTVDLFLQILVNGFMSGGMYALVASGFTLILGVTQVFNFAQGHFYMLGAFVAYGVVTSLGLPYPVAVLAAMVAMGLLGILFHFSIIKWVLPYGIFHTLLATVALGTIINQVSLLTFGYNEGVMNPVVSGSFDIAGIVLSKGKLLVIICAVLIMVALHYFMQTKVGTAMLAAAENREVAGLQGINAKQIFWITMAIGCALSGIAGGLIVPVLAASYNMGEKIFIKSMMVVMIGGMGSMSGALLAAFMVGIIESFAFQFVGELNLLVIFVFMGILSYFRPGGLLGKPMPLPGQ
jgi:branched-chain amino acid transport system permease protein